MDRYEEARFQGAASKSYTTPAIITLVLYFVLWLPGLIANVVYLLEANRTQQVTGRSPEGKGCLVALLVVFIVLPVLGFCVFFGGLGALGIGGSAQ